ncbi:2og-fe oxygenase [Ophiostoma piceae UAMH 11346]|uniref:2og-fe oxygenase n=1 Tax=Ophiostoma piceae (strain UAMH 11346) TaxID=1262450 RepID=S3C5H1_OPHP1|nr:2og-fe oxygenase [Ophiostoma piceae UAMH 11346]
MSIEVESDGMELLAKTRHDRDNLQLGKAATPYAIEVNVVLKDGVDSNNAVVVKHRLRHSLTISVLQNTTNITKEYSYINVVEMQTFEKIPTLDLSWTNQDDTRREPLLAQLRHALVDVGFLYIVNHGVPDNIISDMTAVLPILFSLTDVEKEQIALHNSPHFLGYSAPGAETTAGKADQREQVEFATELPSDWAEGKPIYERLRGPNQWPASLPTLKPIVQAYIDALTSLSERFLGLVAEALYLQVGGEDGTNPLQPFLSDQHRLKLVRYPAASAGADGEVASQGVGPHKDSSGWWTFLLQASPPHIKGLQALNREGVWIDVPVVAGSFVVNIGQAFEVVTGGLCPATTHRVLAGPYERFSVPFFQGVRRSLTKEEALGTLKNQLLCSFPGHFGGRNGPDDGSLSKEANEGKQIDSAFLRGQYDTWGESQLRTKIRSHRDVGKKYYSDVFHKYAHDN